MMAKCDDRRRWLGGQEKESRDVAAVKTMQSPRAYVKKVTTEVWPTSTELLIL